jgi:hypothetical protein
LSGWDPFQRVAEKMKARRSQIEIFHYVTVRSKATGELLVAWPFRKRSDAEVKSKEADVAKLSNGITSVVDIETLEVGSEPYPPQMKKRRAR